VRKRLLCHYLEKALSNVKLLSLICLACLVLVSACAAPAPELADTRHHVAVWDLEDVSPMGGGRAELASALSSKVMEALAENPDVVLVERQKLLLALEELQLGASSLADDNTRLRIGRLAGAREMVFGAYQVIAGQLRIDLRMVDVETGRIVATAATTETSSGLDAWLAAAGRAGRALLELPAAP